VKSRGSRRSCRKGLATEFEDFEGSGRNLKDFMEECINFRSLVLIHEELCLRCGMWMPCLRGGVLFLSAVEKVVFCLSLLTFVGYVPKITVHLTERSHYFFTWGVERNHFEARLPFHALSNPAKPSRHPSFTSALPL
jgi:hypothetical protein